MLQDLRRRAARTTPRVLLSEAIERLHLRVVLAARHGIAELRGALDKQGVRKKFEPYIAKIEHDYREMQETLLSAGMSGLNLAVVFHEVERGVRALHQFIVDGSDPSAAAGQASELMHLLDGFSTLLKRDSRQSHSARNRDHCGCFFCLKST